METTNKDLITISKDDLFELFKLGLEQLKTDKEQNSKKRVTKARVDSVICEDDFPEVDRALKPKQTPFQAKSPKLLWTVKQVSDYTAYKTSTIYAFVNQNKIPYIKLNGRLFFDKKVIDQWMVGESS